jgi:hypothetical protein
MGLRRRIGGVWNPAINRWAIFNCPYGTGKRRNFKERQRSYGGSSLALRVSVGGMKEQQSVSPNAEREPAVLPANVATWIHRNGLRNCLIAAPVKGT